MSVNPTLAMALNEISQHSVDEIAVPSYKFYNVHFKSGDVLARYNKENGVPNNDARTGAYLAHYFGEDAEDETIVAQQVLKVLDAFVHHTADIKSEPPEETILQYGVSRFENHLKDKLAISDARAAELARLAPQVQEAIGRLPTVQVEIGWKEKVKVDVIDWSKADSDLISAVAVFTESVKNSKSQPENFLGTAPIVQRLMKNPRFYKWAAIEARQPLQSYPVFGVFQAKLGYKNATSLDEADKAQQALMRILLLPQDSIDLVQMKDFYNPSAAPNPFPIKGDVDKEFTFPDVQPYAIDVQTAAQMIRSMASVQSNLHADEVRALRDLRLKWSYLSSREIIHVYGQEQEAAHSDGKVTLANKIGEMMAYTKEFQEAADTLIDEHNIDLGFFAALEGGYDERAYHDAREQLLSETHDLFERIVPKALYGREQMIEQTLERANVFMRVTNKQRAAYVEKLDASLGTALSDEHIPTEP